MLYRPNFDLSNTLFCIFGYFKPFWVLYMTFWFLNFIFCWFFAGHSMVARRSTRHWRRDKSTWEFSKEKRWYWCRISFWTSRSKELNTAWVEQAFSLQTFSPSDWDFCPATIHGNLCRHLLCSQCIPGKTIFQDTGLLPSLGLLFISISSLLRKILDIFRAIFCRFWFWTNFRPLG